MNKPKVIFFDADGVILKGGHTFTKQLSQQYKLDMQKVISFFESEFLACSTGKADIKEELSKVIADWGWNGTVDELIKFWFTEGTIFDEGNIEFARKLSAKGIPASSQQGRKNTAVSF